MSYSCYSGLQSPLDTDSLYRSLPPDELLGEVVTICRDGNFLAQAQYLTKIPCIPVNELYCNSKVSNQYRLQSFKLLWKFYHFDPNKIVQLMIDISMFQGESHGGSTRTKIDSPTLSIDSRPASVLDSRAGSVMDTSTSGATTGAHRGSLAHAALQYALRVINQCERSMLFLSF